MEKSVLKSSAVVLLSGGQDSTTCLYWAKQNFDEVLAISFYYGQRHHHEIDSAKIIAKLANVSHDLVDANVFSQFDDSALLHLTKNISDKHRVKELPASFVPGRNVIFLTLAAMYAYKRGIRNLVAGMCQTDYSDYYDCRNTAIMAQEKSLSENFSFQFSIFTPLMHLTKAQTVELATTMPGCMEALKYSLTCYEGTSPPCGKCPACLLREKGFKEAGIEDPANEGIIL